MYSKNCITDIVPITDDTVQKLQDFCDVLVKWQRAINLVSKYTLNPIWHRHIADSMQVYPLIPKTAKTVADLGSGGGLPAIVLGILATDKNVGRDIHITLIESDKKKALFLQTCVRELQLNATVINRRIEHINGVKFDILTARALCEVSMLIEFMKNLHTPCGVFLKGKNVDIEIQNAQQKNAQQQNTQPQIFSITKTPSVTNSESVILSVFL